LGMENGHEYHSNDDAFRNGVTSSQSVERRDLMVRGDEWELAFRDVVGSIEATGSSAASRFENHDSTGASMTWVVPMIRDAGKAGS